MAFVEDDDAWQPRRLEYGLKCIAECELVTSNQLEVEPDGRAVRVNDYPTPSGWLMPRAIWERLGGFDESFTFVDSEFLGRAQQLGIRRVHRVEHGAGKRDGLEQVARFSTIWRTAEAKPLVLRTVNPAGVMGTVQQQEAARLRHEGDCRKMVEKYGGRSLVVGGGRGRLWRAVLRKPLFPGRVEASIKIHPARGWA